MKDRSRLTTEKRNPRSRRLDRMDTLEIVDVINAEDARVAPAVAKHRKEIASAAELITERLRRGGRLIYVGAGTSGRLGMLDASECPPTFGIRPSMVQGIIAGGRRALVRSVEGAEDCAEDGRSAVNAKRITGRDVVVGIAACGLTPFVLEAVKRGREVVAATVLVTCSPESPRCAAADIVISPVVGPEVVTGSTRMKAGTATKLVLNTLTTTVMIRLGKVYENLMVDLRATNEKLRDRSERIVMELAGVGRQKARKLLVGAEGAVKVALVMFFRDVSSVRARKILNSANQSLRKAISRDTQHRPRRRRGK